nr:immunoglobulin heavy chain junction region [Mus musculus]
CVYGVRAWFAFW